MAVPDRIHKVTILRAPIARVWRAVSDPRELGAWFGMEVDGPFVPGQWVSAEIRPTTVDPEIAKLQEPHAGTRFELLIEELEAPRRFAFRWHPFPVKPGLDPSAEPTTLVTFELTEVEGGTRLEITESGFDALPLERRADAYCANEGGWEGQLTLVTKYVDAG